jgi:competence protein ComGC
MVLIGLVIIAVLMVIAVPRIIRRQVLWSAVCETVGFS